MQLHDIKPTQKIKKNKRVGRGGKRGTYSGKGMKGQKSRAGARIRPGFRGGDNPVWKQFAKQRGSSKRVEVKHSTFSIKYNKPAVLNLSVISHIFQEGDAVSPKILIKKGLVSTNKNGIKILSQGELDKKLKFSGLEFSKAALIKIEKSNSVIVK